MEMRDSSDEDSSGVKVGLGTVYYYTTSGLDTLERISSRKQWDNWHDIGIVAMVVSMVASLGFMALSAVAVLLADPPSSATADPKNVLAIPGVNDFIPLEQAGMFILVLFISIVIHEGGHAIAALREDISVEEWGFITLLGVIPLGAYVKPNEQELQQADIRALFRVMSAGIMNNYMISLLAWGYFLLGSTPSLGEVFSAHLSLVVGNMAFFEFGVVATFLYWIIFLNVNLGLINTLPIVGLDGGQIVSAWSEGNFESQTAFAIKAGATVSAIGLFVLTAFGPML